MYIHLVACDVGVLRANARHAALASEHLEEGVVFDYTRQIAPLVRGGVVRGF